MTAVSTPAVSARGSWLRRAVSNWGRAPAAREQPAQPPRPLSPVKPEWEIFHPERKPAHVHQFDDAGWGHTVLVDSDGHGVIRLGDVMLSDCTRVAEGMWVDASRDFSLFTIKRKGGVTDLAICRRDDPSGGCIVVHDWSPARSLGICLG